MVSLGHMEVAALRDPIDSKFINSSQLVRKKTQEA